MKKTMMAAVLSSGLVVAACGGGKTGKPDVEGCEHLKEGPAVAVNATATGSGAPSVAADHKRYDVALTDVPGGKGGTVKYAVAVAGDYLFYLGADVPAKFLDPASAEVAPEAKATSVTQCTEVKARYLVPLKVGTYSVSFGPTTATSVGLVIEPAAHAD